MIIFSNRYTHKAALAFLMPTLLLVSTLVQAADIKPIVEPIAETLGQADTRPVVVESGTNPQRLWEEYLLDGGYNEGLNDKAGKSFFIQSATVRVRGSFGNEWIAARNEAFESAELLAKARMAEAIGAEVKSKRNLKFFSQGADLSPSEQEIIQLHNELSLVEKGERLMSAELDAQLRRHYPDWDGTGASPADKQRKVATAGTALRNEMSSNAREIIRGATTVFQTEGLDDRDHYVVLVGIVWSQQMSLVARSLTDPEIQLPVGTPGKPIRQILATRQAQDPFFLAKFNGIRVWRDEQGRRVVVSVASHDRGNEDFIAERKNEVVARNRIARFSAESVGTDQGTTGDRSYREFADSSSANFDAERYEESIEGIVETTRISGALVVKKWRGIHPISGTPMITTVMVWRPDNAQRIGEFSREVAKPVISDRQRVDVPAGSTPRTLTGPAADFDDF